MARRMCIDMSNFAQSAQTTVGQINAALEAQNGIGKGNFAAQVIRDPDTGKVIQVNVTLPDSVAQADLSTVAATISNNPGVATAVTPIPSPLFIFDLTDIVLASLVLASGQLITVTAENGLLPMQSTRGVVLLGRRDDAAFVSGLKNTTGQTHASIIFRNDVVGSDLDIPVNDITLAFDATTKPLLNTAIITVPAKLALGIASFKGFWIANDGKLYLGLESIDGSVVVQRNFESAVEAGAV